MTGSSTASTPVAPASGGVAVLGAGLMGHAIAFVFASHGWDTALFDASEAALETAQSRIDARAVEVGVPPVTVATHRSLEAAVSGRSLVIEAVAEDLEVKREVLARAQAAAPGAVLASNTSVIPVRDIAAGLVSGSSFLGTHWWNPPHLIDIVELVSGPDTSSEVVRRVEEWLVTAGKTPVRVRKDVPGFIGNRMQFALWREAMYLVEAGVCDAETVDLVARETFGRRLHALGPLENADYIGLELTRSIMRYVLPSLAADGETPAALSAMLASGHTGARAGEGFRLWGEGSFDAVTERLRNELLGQLTVPEEGVDAQEVRRG